VPYMIIEGSLHINCPKYLFFRLLKGAMRRIGTIFTA
jgi:hypothetical protein